MTHVTPSMRLTAVLYWSMTGDGGETADQRTATVASRGWRELAKNAQLCAKRSARPVDVAPAI